MFLASRSALRIYIKKPYTLRKLGLAVRQELAKNGVEI